ncbi:MAG: metallophosphoesterase [Bacilli bacterium]|nr:metallophosphoesterase [Bacilli bacterium]
MKKLGLLVMPLMTISLLASCGTKEHTIRFDVNNGTPEVESQIVKDGECANEPQVSVTRGDETLKFWSLNDEDEDNPTKFIFKDNKITSDITLHAIFWINPGPAPKLDLLWGTEIKPVSHTTKLIKDQEYTTIAKYNEDGSISDDFKIMILTDTHLDSEKNTTNAAYTTMVKNIMYEQPDFVVFCGDICTEIFNEGRAIQFAKTLEELGVYWSCVLGNHEGDFGTMDRQEMIDMWSKYDHCLIDPSIKHTSDGDLVSGVGNHVINILGSDNKVAQSLFFLESGRVMSNADKKIYNNEIQWMIDNGKCKASDIKFYDYIKDSQISWYQETFKKIRSISPNANSTVFSHNPIKDMEDAYLDYLNKEWEGEGKSQGIGAIENIWPYTDATYAGIDNDGVITGRRREDMNYSPHDVRYAKESEHTPIFNAMKSFGEGQSFFCGHDHLNDFVLRKDGIIMGYIEPINYSSYNLFSKGLLGQDPYMKEYPDDYLIEGYTTINFNLNVKKINSIQHYKNFELYGELNQEITEFVEDLRGPYKSNHDKYKNDPNNPFYK